MNILFINERVFPDYLADSVFHGLKQLSCNVHEFSDDTAWYMYDTEQSRNRWKEMFGNDKGSGFTLFHTLKKDRTISTDKKYRFLSIEDRIENKYYDKIIYGTTWSSLPYLDEICSVYDKNDIIFLDGNDEEFNWYPRDDNGNEIEVKCNVYSVRNTTQGWVTDIGKVFKREIPITFIGNVFPISIGFPEELIVDKVPEKTQEWCPVTGTNFPNWVAVSDKKYGFGEQDLYYEEIQKSSYGFTMRKAGWDCMRHYEIMGNGTIPHFHKLEDCPPKTLHNFPKELILKTNKKKPEDSYNDVVLELLDYMRNNLTTKKVAEYVLS